MILGSPPHTWRIPRNVFRSAVKTRITSTHVENTTISFGFWCVTLDHLHTRGEYYLLTNQQRQHLRITSTHVENTHSCQLLPEFGKDHLHTRGEYSPTLYHEPFLLGSPPHTWRIRLLSRQSTSSVRDHLHTRGEYFMLVKLDNPSSGSPPHTWRILRTFR